MFEFLKRNKWRPFPEVKPESSRWYQCTVEVPNQQRYVMDLYWYENAQVFRDNRVQHVFDVYDVYGYGDGNKRKRLSSNELCNRTADVVAWREIPEPYMKGFSKEEVQL